MASEDKSAAALPPDAAKRRPGRPRKAPETPEQRIARLQAELQDAQSALKAAEENRAAIVGTAAIRHARAHAEFRRHLAAALRAEVKSKADLAAIADLLNGSRSDPTS